MPAPLKNAEAARDLAHALLIEQAFVDVNAALSEVETATKETRLPLLLDILTELSHQHGLY
jgi:hypothetical protein